MVNGGENGKKDQGGKDVTTAMIRWHWWDYEHVYVQT